MDSLGRVERALLFLLLAQPSSSLLPAILHTSISCDKSDFLLKIRFNSSFTGLIYTEKGAPNCIYADGAVQPNAAYHLKIPLSGCETRRNSEGNLENELVVQGGRAFSAAHDKRFLLTCIPAQPQNSQVTVNFGGVTVDTVASTAASISAAPSDIDYQVAVLDGVSPDSPVLLRPLAVGDKVSYSVRVDGRGSAARIGRCWATDGRSSLQLADERGCSLQTAGDVWTDFRVSRSPPDTTVFLNYIKAWAFPTSNEVNIFCNLHVCRGCSQPSCDRSRRSLASLSATAVSPSQEDTVVAIRTSFRLRRAAATVAAEAQQAPPSGVSALPFHVLLPLCSAAFFFLPS